MPRLVPVEPCPSCRERALVSGACRCCGHLEPEALERCDDELPVGAVPGRGVAEVRRRWIIGRGLLGAIAAGPLAGTALGLLVLARRVLPPAAFIALAVGFAVLAWVFAAMLVNWTVIELRDRHLAVRHGPLPLPGISDLCLSAMEIERLSMRRDAEALAAGGHASAGGLFESYSLVVHSRGGAARVVYTSADREEVARMLRYLREALPVQRRSAR